MLALKSCCKNEQNFRVLFFFFFFFLIYNNTSFSVVFFFFFFFFFVFFCYFLFFVVVFFFCLFQIDTTAIHFTTLYRKHEDLQGSEITIKQCVKY